MTTSATSQPISDQQILDSLIAERGGVSKFTDAQVHFARIIVRLMSDMASAKVGEAVRHATEITRLLDCLPPALPGFNAGQQPRDRMLAGMSLHEMAAVYQRMLADPTAGTKEPNDEFDARLDAALYGPVIDGVAEPPADTISATDRRCRIGDQLPL